MSSKSTKYVTYTRADQKITELFFQDFIKEEYKLFKVITFKVLPFADNAPLPTLFPALERGLEGFFWDVAKLVLRTLFDVVDWIESSSLQREF